MVYTRKTVDCKRCGKRKKYESQICETCFKRDHDITKTIRRKEIVENTDHPSLSDDSGEAEPEDLFNLNGIYEEF